MTTEDEIRAARQVMRRVQAHLLDAHQQMGAQVENVGFVDVIHHPTTELPYLNYVTPRRNTAWVSAQHITDGLHHLEALQREARLRFAEGLYPPMFQKALLSTGLTLEEETPVSVYTIDPDRPFIVPYIASHYRVRQVNSAEGMGIWWYVWRNAHYDVQTTSIEPLHLGMDLRGVTLGQRIDLILYRHDFPVGVARITCHEGSAHLSAQALLREVRSEDLSLRLQALAVQAALQADCDLIFVAGSHDDERERARNLGFVDVSSMLCYAQPAPAAQSDDAAVASESGASVRSETVPAPSVHTTEAAPDDIPDEPQAMRPRAVYLS